MFVTRFRLSLLAMRKDINEEDFEPNDPNRVCGVEDRYRSEYLTIYRDVDEQGQPIYDAEYYGYDEGDPEDPNDDNYIYLIRRYRLEDLVFMGESKDASEGEVWLYNPDLEKVGTWEISSLQCLNHDNECDGLHAVYEEGHDTRHALLVPVPVSMMEYAGTYIFVLHIKDNHPELYRDHQPRWTLELNGVHKAPGYAVWCTGGATYNGLDTTNVGQRCAYWLKRAGYKPWKPDGSPERGGSGTLRGTDARLTIRTLNRLSPTDPPEERSKCTRNAVWVFYGHSGPHDIVFRDLVNRELISNSQQEDPSNGIFNILNAGFALDHVRFVFLAGCDNAGYPSAFSNKEASTAGSFYNSKLVDAGVGFRGPVYADSFPYRRFFEIFWKGVCKDHWRVGEAICLARRSIRAWLLRIFGVKPAYPEVRGKNTRLYPAAYGR